MSGFAIAASTGSETATGPGMNNRLFCIWRDLARKAVGLGTATQTIAHTDAGSPLHCEISVPSVFRIGSWIGRDLPISRRRRSSYADHLDVVADRGYFNSVEILACEQADITVTLSKADDPGREDRWPLWDGRPHRASLRRFNARVYEYTLS